MSYHYCPKHGTYIAHAQFLHNEQLDSNYGIGIQRNGTLINMNRYSNVSQTPDIYYKDYNNSHVNSNLFYQTQEINQTQDIYSTTKHLNDLSHTHEVRRTHRKKVRAASKKSQRLLIVRHGERVDTTFGGLWLQNSFKNGNILNFYIDNIHRGRCYLT